MLLFSHIIVGPCYSGNLICSYYKPKYFAYSLASKTWLVFRDKHECSQRTMHGVPSETLMDAQCNDTF